MTNSTPKPKPNNRLDFSQYDPPLVLPAPSLADACVPKHIFGTPAFDLASQRPMPMSNIHEELQDIRQGIADIKAMFAGRPAPLEFQRNSEVLQSVTRLCPVCGINELRPKQKTCSGKCRVELSRTRKAKGTTT